MLETMLDRHIIFVLMGILSAVGIMSKLIVNVALKRLVRAAGNMNKSNHPLMRLVRAKFEHASMVSDKVENVRVFVDKYLYEYKVLGLRIHSWRRMEKASAGLCLLAGAGGAGIEYGINGMSDLVWKTGAVGGGLAAFVYLVHLLTDEKYQMEAIRNYMVDFLENVCRHRFEKSYQKEIKVLSKDGASGEFGVMPAEAQNNAKEAYAVRKKETAEDLFAVRNLEQADESLYDAKSKSRSGEREHTSRRQGQSEEQPYMSRGQGQSEELAYASRGQGQSEEQAYASRGQGQSEERAYASRGQGQPDEQLYGSRNSRQSDDTYAQNRGQSDEDYAVRKREPSQGQSAVSAFLAAELKAGESVFRVQETGKDEAVNAFRTADLRVDEVANAFRMSESIQGKGGNEFRTQETRHREGSGEFRPQETGRNEGAGEFRMPETSQNDGISAFRMPETGQDEETGALRTLETGRKESVEIEKSRGREKRKENIVEIPVPEPARESMESIVIEAPEPSEAARNGQGRQAPQKERAAKREKSVEELDRDVVIRRILEEFMA